MICMKINYDNVYNESKTIGNNDIKSIFCKIFVIYCAFQ